MEDTYRRIQLGKLNSEIQVGQAQVGQTQVGQTQLETYSSRKTNRSTYNSEDTNGKTRFGRYKLENVHRKL